MHIKAHIFKILITWKHEVPSPGYKYDVAVDNFEYMNINSKNMVWESINIPKKYVSFFFSSQCLWPKKETLWTSSKKKLSFMTTSPSLIIYSQLIELALTKLCGI